MTENELELCQKIYLNDSYLKKICQLRDLDEMFAYAKELVKDLSEEEFFEFILKAALMCGNYKDVEELSDDMTAEVAGGKSNFTSKIIAVIFSLMFLPFNNVSGAKNYEPDNSTVFSSISNSILNKYQKIKKEIEDNPKAVKKAIKAVGIAALAGTVIIGTAVIYKKSDNFFQRAVIGQKEDLREIPNVTGGEAINVSEDLKGYVYKGNKQGELSGKYIIFYSGSGSSNASQIQDVLKMYLKKGATVVGVDYKGFGESGEAVSGGKIRQSGIYSDAQKIYDYVNQKLNIQGSDIILHGYSLGGAVAAHVAANVSSKKDELGGLILQSSIKNTGNAAYELLKTESPFVRCIGTLGGFLFADQFDCQKELKRLFSKNSHIPISVCGGNFDDHLRLEQTDLDSFVKKTGFENITVHNGTKAHMKFDDEKGVLVAPEENFTMFSK